MSFNIQNTRRNFLRISAVIGTGLILGGCRGISKSQNDLPGERQTAPEQYESEKSKKVMAVEDLMREHGVLRRALLVYTEIAVRLRTNDFSDTTIDDLRRTTRIFRTFGEEYHEKKLEEAYLFPLVKKTEGEAARYPDILIEQHRRGHELTDYILAITQRRLDINNIEPLARVLESLVLMYRNHTAREDTIVFPAWKQALSGKQYDEMSDTFEDIEHQMFGAHGFENMVRQIGEIEHGLSLSNLAQFTAQPPPKL